MTKIGRNTRFLLQLLLILLCVGADLLTKRIAQDFLRDKDPVGLIPGIIRLCYVENTGAAFGIFNSHTVILSVVTGLALLGGLVWFYFASVKMGRLYNVLIPLIIAGGTGNLIDRVVNGYVIDFFEFLFIEFPVFNLADIFITCCSILLVIRLIYDTIHDKSDSKS